MATPRTEGATRAMLPNPGEYVRTTWGFFKKYTGWVGITPDQLNQISETGSRHDSFEMTL